MGVLLIQSGQLGWLSGGEMVEKQGQTDEVRKGEENRLEVPRFIFGVSAWPMADRQSAHRLGISDDEDPKGSDDPNDTVSILSGP